MTRLKSSPYGVPEVDVNLVEYIKLSALDKHLQKKVRDNLSIPSR